MKKKAGRLKHNLKYAFSKFLFFLFRIFPIKRNRLVVETYRGRKYGDNCRYIVEKLHEIMPEADLVWIRNMEYQYSVPDYIRVVKKGSIRKIYEYATAKVWLSTHYLDAYIQKRNGQFFMDTWHAGLGMKQIGFDNVKRDSVRAEMIRNTADLADVMISNSEYRTRIFRDCLGYKGKIWKCGYPKNDVFFGDRTEFRKKIRLHYHLPEDKKILLYAPTYRSDKEKKTPQEVFDLDYAMLKQAAEKRFGGSFTVFVRWHPVILNTAFAREEKPGAINASDYPEMQELLCAVDVFVSDYSSGIFDAAFCGMPCFIYANDLKEYQKVWGLNYEMSELPFPFAETNEELRQQILEYDEDENRELWNAFTEKEQLMENGHATEELAGYLKKIMTGETIE